MSEGGVPNEAPTPGKGQRNPTEASKGFLGRVADVVKGGAQEVKLALGDPLFPKSPEAEKPTPTEASKSFLRDWRRKLLSPLDFATKFPMGLATTGAATALIKNLGGFNIQSDIAEGRWETVAAKGVLAGIGAAPFIRIVKDLLKKDE